MAEPHFWSSSLMSANVQPDSSPTGCRAEQNLEMTRSPPRLPRIFGTPGFSSRTLTSWGVDNWAFPR
jgi:hypothetical protein